MNVSLHHGERMRPSGENGKGGRGEASLQWPPISEQERGRRGQGVSAGGERGLEPRKGNGKQLQEALLGRVRCGREVNERESVQKTVTHNAGD